jgi:hypothetical protein
VSNHGLFVLRGKQKSRGRPEEVLHGFFSNSWRNLAVEEPLPYVPPPPVVFYRGYPPHLSIPWEFFGKIAVIGGPVNHIFFSINQK